MGNIFTRCRQFLHTFAIAMALLLLTAIPFRANSADRLKLDDSLDVRIRRGIHGRVLAISGGRCCNVTVEHPGAK